MSSTDEGCDICMGTDFPDTYRYSLCPRHYNELREESHLYRTARTQLITRLRGRAEQAKNTAEQTTRKDTANVSFSCAVRRNAYETAVLDVEELMTQNADIPYHKHESLEERLTNLEARFHQKVDHDDLVGSESRIASLEKTNAEFLSHCEKLGKAMKAVERNAFPLYTGHVNGHVSAEILSTSSGIKKPMKEGDVGYNLICSERTVIPTDSVVFVKTGVHVKLPPGYWGMITSRSSTVFKHHILVMQGVIDNGYTGELMIPCISMTNQRIVEAGMSIAQLILFPIVTPEIRLVDELPTTERGATGFGSTGA